MNITGRRETDAVNFRRRSIPENPAQVDVQDQARGCFRLRVVKERFGGGEYPRAEAMRAQQTRDAPQHAGIVIHNGDSLLLVQTAPWRRTQPKWMGKSNRPIRCAVGVTTCIVLLGNRIWLCRDYAEAIIGLARQQRKQQCASSFRPSCPTFPAVRQSRPFPPTS